MPAVWMPGGFRGSPGTVGVAVGLADAGAAGLFAFVAAVAVLVAAAIPAAVANVTPVLVNRNLRRSTRVSPKVLIPDTVTCRELYTC